jgi:hypothetical protein
VFCISHINDIHTILQELLANSYVIIDGPAAVHDPMVSRSWFCNDEASTSLPGARGRYRHQISSGGEGRMLREKLSRAMDVAGVLLGREVLPSQDALYALRTEEGAAEQGLMHTDWPVAVCARYEGDKKPGSAIWAAFAAFELLGPEGETIHVGAGKMVVFQGDWWHCGGPHSSQCLRVHTFLRPLGSSLGPPAHVHTDRSPI